MSKLLNLKGWLTVSDAAKNIAARLDEEVSESDIYRFALDGHLRLSVHLINYTRATPGFPLARWEDRTSPFAIPLTCKEQGIDGYDFLGPSRIIGGVVDLLLQGGERMDVESKYLSTIGLPPVRKNNAECAQGVYAIVGGEIGTLFEDGGAFYPAHEERIYLLEHHVSHIENEAYRRELYELIQEDFPDHGDREWGDPVFFEPAYRLPRDISFIVRAPVLQAFVEGLNVTEGAQISGSMPAPEKFKESLEIVLSKIEERATGRNMPFDRRSMPGLVRDFQELFDNFTPPLFGKGYRLGTFKQYLYRAGICNVDPSVKKSSAFYADLFPELYKDSNTTDNY